MKVLDSISKVYYLDRKQMVFLKAGESYPTSNEYFSRFPFTEAIANSLKRWSEIFSGVAKVFQEVNAKYRSNTTSDDK